MKNCISRRSFLKAAGILGAAGALAACGGSSASTSTAASTAGSTAASAAASSTSIKLWTYPIGGWGNDETVQGLVSSFNAKYPDIKVTVEYLDYTNGDDQVNTAIEGGSAPDLIMEGPERLVANWGAKGVMAPLNDLWTDDAKKDIYESVESACKDTAGNYYEYPLCMTAHCMAVNMTKVKEVGADQYIDTDKHTWSTDGFLKKSYFYPGTGRPAGERGTGGHRGGEEGHPGHAAPGERILHTGNRGTPGGAGQLCHRLGGQGPEIPAGYELGVWRPNSVFFSTSSTVSSRFISCCTADTPNRKLSL